MRITRALAVVAALSLTALVAWSVLRWLGSPRDVGSREARVARQAHSSPGDALRLSLQLRLRPTRDLFQYRDVEAASSASLALATVPPEPPPFLEQAEPALRLLGFIHKGGRLVAALSVHGQVRLAGAGDSLDDHGLSIVEVDEDLGVRVSGPQGEQVLAPGP